MTKKKRRNPTVTVSLTPAEQASLRKQIDKGQVTYGGSLVKANPVDRLTPAQKKMMASAYRTADGAQVVRVSNSIGSQSTAFSLRRMGLIRDERHEGSYGGVRWVVTKANPLRMGETEKVAIILGLAAGTFALVYYFATSLGKATGAAVGGAV